MGKIKQGILGGFKGKVGTVIGSSWNGIAYMKGLPQSVKNSKSAAQIVQRDFFKEVQGLASQLTAEQLNFLFPSSPKGMTRRNAIVQQLSADPIIEADSKHVDLANLGTIGNAPIGRKVSARALEVLLAQVVVLEHKVGLYTG